jgi:hypothetical protein
MSASQATTKELAQRYLERGLQTVYSEGSSFCAAVSGLLRGESRRILAHAATARKHLTGYFSIFLVHIGTPLTMNHNAGGAS